MPLAKPTLHNFWFSYLTVFHRCTEVSKPPFNPPPRADLARTGEIILILSYMELCSRLLIGQMPADITSTSAVPSNMMRPINKEALIILHIMFNLI